MLQAAFAAMPNHTDYRIATANDASACMRRHEKHAPDCAFIHYQPPGDTSMEIIKLLHHLPSHGKEHLPLVVVADHEDDILMQRIRNQPYTRFALTKDLSDPKHLKMLIEHMLRPQWSSLYLSG